MLNGGAVMPDAYAAVDDQTIKSPAFKRLCHLAALDEQGDKRQAVVDGLIITAMLYRDGPWRDWTDWQQALDDIYGLELTEEEIQGGIDRSLAEGRLTRAGRPEYSLSPKQREVAERKIRDAEALEKRVRDNWLSQIPPSLLESPGADTLWSALQEYMAKAFRQHGVETISLLTTEPVQQTDGLSMAQLLEAAITETTSVGSDRDAVGEAIKEFFEVLDPERVKYVTQLLDGTVSFFSLRVDPETADFLKGSLPPLSIFLDTNVIFGLLDIHDSPMAGVTREAIRAITVNRLPFKLYYHARTLKELDMTLDAIGSHLRSRTWSPALSRAALGFAQAMSGIELRYHRLNSQSPTPVSAYLSRYANLPELLNSYGCQIYRDPNNLGYTTEMKGELIAEYQEYAKDMRRRNPRPYEALDHDIVVWLATQRGRKGSRKAALDSGSILLSADFLLWRFDHEYLRVERKATPCVVLPTSLMQVLRPFSATIPNFDAAFLRTFAAPEFRALGVEAEKTIGAVLAYLATFSDLPEETARRILANSIVMKRLGRIDSRSKDFATIIDQQMVDQNAGLLEERIALENQLKERRRAEERAKAELQQVKARLEEVAESGQAQMEREQQVEIDSQSALEAERAKAAGAIRQAKVYRAGLLGLVALVSSLVVYYWSYGRPIAFLRDHPNRLGIVVTALTAVWTIPLIGFRRLRAVAFTILVVDLGALLTIISKGK